MNEPAPETVLVREVGPRDGFQSLAGVLPTAAKARAISCLAAAGCSHVQAASFVHPEKVPQMADAAELFALLPKDSETVFSALALNPHGMERAMASGVGLVEASVSASDAHGRKNAGMELSDALKSMKRMAALAQKGGVVLWAGLQCAFGYQRAGDVSPAQVGKIASTLLDAGAEVLVLADTSGLGTPDAVEAVLETVCVSWPVDRLLLHLHDSRGQAMANLDRGLALGIRRFDASLGGLGGCPFLPGAPGNLPTQAVVRALGSRGIATGIDAEAVERCFEELVPLLKKMETG
ncbi:MAG: hydroxymethylglutaryl-CoA lyase [Deltaproteobacteria bacterium]|nr:hydroxymethylglutaryl-CoA lyase [Deltaproteobacteria bacterium]